MEATSTECPTMQKERTLKPIVINNRVFSAERSLSKPFKLSSKLIRISLENKLEKFLYTFNYIYTPTDWTVKNVI